LGRILGVGADAAARLYVGEEPSDLHDRVFLSDGDALRRSSVSGTGRRGVIPDADYNLGFQDGTIARSLVIQVRSGVTTAMGLAPAGSRVFIGDAAADIEPLTLMTTSDIAGRRLENLPRAVDDVFQTEDGRSVVVTADGDDGAEDVQLFFGRPDSLVQRTIAQFGRSLDGATTADFDVDGKLASLRSYGAATTLAIGNEPVVSASHVLPTPSQLPDSSFQCLAGDASAQ
jgi:hypothetical protein